MTTETMAFVGFGEAVMAFRAGWGADAPGALRAIDIKTHAPATAPAMKDRYAAMGTMGLEGGEDDLGLRADRVLDKI
ncbi:MAG TPA: hypothetical protein VLA27_03320 [Paracoccaceae bacterium]|nr:hypothetical protein [Paracoccaceae bacterium]